jgi:hypothetical protein
MTTYTCVFVLTVTIIGIQCCSGITINDIPYSISPDGQLSTLGTRDRRSFGIGRHPNDSSIWPMLSKNLTNAFWNYEEFYAKAIHSDLEYINHVVAIDANRFVYVSISDEDECEIGVVKIIWRINDSAILKKLNSRKLFVQTINTLLAYDIQLGSNIYFTSTSDFVVYNFKTFRIRMIDWADTTNMSIIEEPTSLLIIDRTHLLIGSEISLDYDDFDDGDTYCAIALAQIDFSLSPLDMFIISYKMIFLPDTNHLAEFFLHISLAINNHGDLLIGLPAFQSVVLAYLNLNDWQLTLHNRSFPIKDAWIDFGYSVAWLPDQRQFAVNAYNASEESLSHSLIFFYNFDDEELWVRNVFPNSQQLTSESSAWLYFHNFILLHGTYFGIITSATKRNLVFLILLSASSGTLMFDFDSLNYDTYPYLFGTVQPCLPGTYKIDNTSLGPCIPCPAGTKAPTYGSIQCETCSNTLNCPLGSIDDQFKYPRMTQIAIYPESSDSTSFDDIILSNIFTFDCLLISPVFWMFITIGIVTFFLIMIRFLSLLPCMLNYHLKVLRAFKYVDLVGRGHLWIGGLVSCGIFVLIVFATLFSFKYIHLYPIEQINYSSFVCNSQTNNVKFTSGLQLLALPKSDEERPIFELLGEQPLNLTLDLINTLIDCSHIDINQRNSEYVTDWHWFGCLKDEKNVTVTLVIPLSSHMISIIINISTPYTVGIVRVCLKGMNKTTADNRYLLRELLVCEVFSDTNHSMKPNVEFDITLTKVINRTDPFESGQLPTYSGLWIPLISSKGATTKLMWVPGKTDFRRNLYLSSSIIVRQTESLFYIQNTQKPIAHKFEIYFHNVLFIAVVLELFELIFLINKLVLFPIVRRLLNCVNRDRKQSEPNQTRTNFRKINSKRTELEPVKVGSIRSLISNHSMATVNNAEPNVEMKFTVIDIERTSQ